jgi:hypothetical protein
MKVAQRLAPFSSRWRTREELDVLVREIAESYETDEPAPGRDELVLTQAASREKEQKTKKKCGSSREDTKMGLTKERQKEGKREERGRTELGRGMRNRKSEEE